MIRQIFILVTLTPVFLGLVIIKKPKECTLKETIHSFDFTKLSRNEDYIIQHDTHTFLRLQLCGPLKHSCNDQEGYSVCLSKGGKEVPIGKVSPYPDTKSGEIKFQYNGDKCDDHNNYSVEIKMLCDLTNPDKVNIAWYPVLSNQCHYNLTWRTSAACEKQIQIDCTVNNTSGYYDLSPLINYKDNYEVPLNNNTSLIFNVCHNILYKPGICKSDSAACLVDNKSHSYSKSLGQLQNNLTINTDNQLVLSYEDGDVCFTNKKSMRTTITFICDLNISEPLPKFEKNSEECDYKFIWRTVFACSEEYLFKHSIKTENSAFCRVKHPVVDYTYDLSALMNEKYTIKPTDAKVFNFAVCNSITNTTCRANSGVCEIHTNISWGVGNAKLMWKDGPYLNYTNGDLCNATDQHRYTLIEFNCGSDDIKIEEYPCYNLIKMKTNLACIEKEKRFCAALEQLSLQTNNYEIKTTDALYYINVCRPLVPLKNINCTFEAGICKININGNGNTINLGYPNHDPIQKSEQSAILMYSNGAVCEEDKNRQIQSNITFVCDINNKNTKPQFKAYNNCTYFFEWKINIICGKVHGSLENCLINNKLGDYRNLTTLITENSSDIQVTNNEKNKTYKICLCGDKKNCKGGFIYDGIKMYGTKVSVLTDYALGLVHLKFTEGDKCNESSLAQATLTIICGDDTSNQPIVIDEDSCHVKLEWRTKKICKLQNISTFNSTTSKTTMIDVPNKTSLLNGGQITGIVILILIILLIIYFLKASRRFHFIQLIFGSTRRNSYRAKYSRVSSKASSHSSVEQLRT